MNLSLRINEIKMNNKTISEVKAIQAVRTKSICKSGRLCTGLIATTGKSPALTLYREQILIRIDPYSSFQRIPEEEFVFCGCEQFKT
jgi:hypothetical protein